MFEQNNHIFKWHLKLSLPFLLLRNVFEFYFYSAVTGILMEVRARLYLNISFLRLWRICCYFVDSSTFPPSKNVETRDTSLRRSSKYIRAHYSKVKKEKDGTESIGIESVFKPRDVFTFFNLQAFAQLLTRRERKWKRKKISIKI